MPAQRYEQVADDLRQKIADGTYSPGQRLPSRVQLMAEYQVSDTVIGKAMMLLRAKKLIETLPGVGVIVAETGTGDPQSG